MPIVVKGSAAATCTQRVLFAANEVGAEIPIDVIDFATKQHKSPEYMKLQPFGKIPVLIDDGFVLYESRAIVRYINEKYQGKLIPKDIQGKALLEQWASLELGTFNSALSTIVGERVFAKYHGRECDAAKAEEALKELQPALDVLETQLSKHQYVAGDELSVIDIYFAPNLNLIQHTPEKSIIESRPHIKAWWARVSSRPAWQKTLNTK